MVSSAKLHGVADALLCQNKSPNLRNSSKIVSCQVLVGDGNPEFIFQKLDEFENSDGIDHPIFKEKCA